MSLAVIIDLLVLGFIVIASVRCSQPRLTVAILSINRISLNSWRRLMIMINSVHLPSPEILLRTLRSMEMISSMLN